MYYANTGYALAPATSTNDSEQQSMSSDAETVSLTDSSVYVLSPLLHRLPLFLFFFAPKVHTNIWQEHKR